MSALATHVASAEAMTRAGNFDSARSHIGKALELDPRSTAAYRALFALELRGGTPRACLEVAEKWLEIDPARPEAHANQFIALCRNGRRREAGDKFDAIAERLGVSPGELRLLRLHYVRQFEAPAKLVREIAAYRREFGDQSSLDKLDMVAKFYAYRTSGMREAAQKVLAASPEDPDAHFVLAVVAFRRGRFARARRHARDFIRTSPAQATVGREIILASWLVWFPPFLVTHFSLPFVRMVSRRPGTFQLVVGAFMLMPVALMSLAGIGRLLHSDSLFPFGHFREAYFAGFSLWFVYQTQLFPQVCNALGGARRPVRLDPGY